MSCAAYFASFVDALVERCGEEKADALLLNPSPRFTALHDEIIQGANALRLPSFGWAEELAQSGGLASYGPSFIQAYRRVAYFVDRIFKGAKPADLPIEQPTQFSLTINKRTAGALGLKVAPSAANFVLVDGGARPDRAEERRAPEPALD